MENQKSKRTPFLRIPAVQTIVASLLCVLAGLLIGFIVLLLINPSGATEALRTIISNFFQKGIQADQQFRQHARENRTAADVLPVRPVFV